MIVVVLKILKGTIFLARLFLKAQKLQKQQDYQEKAAFSEKKLIGGGKPNIGMYFAVMTIL